MVVPDFPKKTRKEIRKQVVTLLKGHTDAKNRVFPNYSVPPGIDELPVILVYPRSEPAELFNQSPKELERKLDLVIECIATGDEVDEEGNSPDGISLEDALDNIAEQVECALDDDDSLNSKADDSILISTEFEFDGGGGKPIGSVRLTYTITYYTLAPRSDCVGDKLDDHDTMNAKWHIGRENDDTVEAEDTVDVST